MHKNWEKQHATLPLKMPTKEHIRLPMEEIRKRDDAVIQRICCDDNFAYYFFHEKCRPLFSNILWTIYGNNGDYDELVNDLYVYLKEPGEDGGFWHRLRTFDFRTSLFDWIKTVAVRHFYTPNDEVFDIPLSLVETGVAKEIITTLDKSLYRRYMYYRYIDKIDNNEIANKLQLELSEVRKLSRRAIKRFKTIVADQYPEYFPLLFSKSEIKEESIESSNEKIMPTSTNGVHSVELKIDMQMFLDSMPNERYRIVLKSLFIDDIAPEDLAAEMNTTVYNIYNIKSRALDQLRDVFLFSNEIHHLEKYISLISDDRSRELLSSLFLKKRSYEEICSELKISENILKRMKQDAIKELKSKIFKVKP